ncbi:Lipoprotein signal peptidase [Candidatus Annandia adelgestsuga]|uniref:Lipoprotein signal peptidase n=1 Tax=Candidatus Annandia adelgestsuga TaxID=1302411 RepID=A0A3S9J795_9ENTR|nr:signal peptidase II [Candidatus Annandia adelgestsuga]AZP36251.1 Lipoprotein signal peptidase [Candidatus Annandia adelgestsuga]
MFNFKKNKILILIFFIIISIFNLDFYSKNIIRYYLNNNYIYINNYINICFIKNYGIIFGILNYNNFYEKYFLIIISFFILLKLINLIYFYVLNSNLIFIILYSFIIGGFLGNEFDRFYYNYVLDFIDFHINNIHILVFNISDYFIILSYIFIFYLKNINYSI